MTEHHATLPGPHQDTVRRHAMLRLLSDRTLVQVVKAMRARDVRPLVLKGPWFAEWLYDDPRDRPPGDVDVIVDPAELPDARQALCGLGFTRRDPPAHARKRAVHHEVWERENLGILTVELHHTLAQIDADPSSVWRCLSRDTRTLQVAGTEVEAPGDAFGALVVGLHAAQHGLTLRKPLQDLEHALARLGDGTWHGAAEMAESLGVSSAFAAGLSLRPHGVVIARRLGLDPAGAQRAVRLREATLTMQWLVSELRELRIQPGLTGKARLVRRLLVPSREWMLRGYPVARRGPGGMAAAYMGRPIRVARMLPWGLRAWLGVSRPLGPRRRWKRLAPVATAALVLGAARIALRLVPFRLILRAVGLGATGSVADVGEAEIARAAAVGAAIRSAAARLPGDSTCLARALAGAVLLRWRGLPAVVHLGVLRAQSPGQIEAHAWLTCGSYVLTGDEGRERFTEIATYS